MTSNWQIPVIASLVSPVVCVVHSRFGKETTENNENFPCYFEVDFRKLKNHNSWIPDAMAILFLDKIRIVLQVFPHTLPNER